jgi:hypothetical protein
MGLTKNCKFGLEANGVRQYNIWVGQKEQTSTTQTPSTNQAGNPSIKCTSPSKSKYECKLYDSSNNQITSGIEWSYTDVSGDSCTFTGGKITTSGLTFQSRGTCVVSAKWNSQTVSKSIDYIPDSSAKTELTIGFMLNGQFTGLLDKDAMDTGEKTYYARKPGSSTNLKVVWDASPSDVCTAPESAATEGKVTAKSAGTCTLTAQYSDNGNLIKKEIDITVSAKEEIPSNKDPSKNNCRDDEAYYGCSSGFICFLAEDDSYTPEQLSDHIQKNSQVMEDYLHWDYSKDEKEIDKGCVMDDRSKLGDGGVYGYFFIDVKKSGLN